MSALLILPSCGGPGGPLSLEEQLEILKADLGAVFSEYGKQDKPLTLYEAMARGVKFNLDQRLMEMEERVAEGNVNISKLDVLPSLNAEGRFVGRSNKGASSSQSLQSGNQSLEPSFSTDQHRKTAELKWSWNTLDSGLAIIRARQVSDQARVAKERRRKVVHNIIQDVRAAYWRAASAQELVDGVEALLTRGHAAVERVRETEVLGLRSPEEALRQQSRILEAMHELMVLRSQLAFAKTELASLIHIPVTEKFRLDVRGDDWLSTRNIPELSIPVEKLDALALVVRPEMREEIFLGRVAENDIRSAIFETIPGVNLLTGFNYDENQFLEDNSWMDFSVSLSQNLVKLFSLPLRLRQAKSKKRLSDLKRQALAMAIFSQVHIAHRRFELSVERFGLMRKLYDVNERMIYLARSRKIAETLTEGEMLEIEIDRMLSRIRTHLSFAEMQNAYGQMINALGLDPLPEEMPDANIRDIANIIETRFERMGNEQISYLVGRLENMNVPMTEKTVPYVTGAEAPLPGGKPGSKTGHQPKEVKVKEENQRPGKEGESEAGEQAEDKETFKMIWSLNK